MANKKNNFKRSVALIAAMAFTLSSMGLTVSADENESTDIAGNIGSESIDESIADESADADVETNAEETETETDVDANADDETEASVIDEIDETLDIEDGDVSDDAGTGNDDTRANANAAVFGKEYSGRLNDSNLHDFYKFTVSAAGVVIMDVVCDCDVTVTRSDGTEVSLTYYGLGDYGEDSRYTLKLPRKGTYYIDMHTYTGMGSSDYKFKLSDSSSVSDGSVAKVSNVKVTAGSNSADITWDRVPGADRYRVYMYLDNKWTGIESITGTSYTVKNLKNGVTYGFAVRVCVNGTWSDYSPSDCVYVTLGGSADNTKTPATDFMATAGDGCANVTWKPVTGADKYRVYYYSYANSKFGLVKTPSGDLEFGASDTSCTVPNLKNGTTYGIVVRAHTSSGWYDYGVKDCKDVTPKAAAVTKTPATDFTATAGDGCANVTWKPVTGADKYRVYYYSYANSRFGLVKTPSGAVEFGANDTSCTVPNLKNGVTYGIVVRAHTSRGWYDYSVKDCKDVTPKASASTNKPDFNIIAGDSKATLVWADVPGATKYQVYYRYGNQNGSLRAVSSNTMIFVASDLTNGTRYGFAVRAFVNGAWTKIEDSDYVYVTPKAATAASKPKAAITQVNDKFALTWEPVKNATKYRVYWRYDADGVKWNAWEKDIKASDLLVVGSTFDTRGRYSFVVRAYVNGAWTTYTNADIVSVTY